MTATQREGLSDAALALTQPVIDELLKDIARRIKDAGAITDTAEYQIYRAQALGESKQAIKAAVARQIKAQDKVIDSLFDYILDNSTPLTANGSLKQIAEGYAKMSRQKTAEQLKNLWADTPQGKVLPIQDAYATALDFAFRQTVTGALDTETAIRRACAPPRAETPSPPLPGHRPAAHRLRAQCEAGLPRPGRAGPRGHDPGRFCRRRRHGPRRAQLHAHAQGKTSVTETLFDFPRLNAIIRREVIPYVR